MSQADEPSYAELKRLYAELVLECAAAKDQNVAYRLQIQDKANENMTYTDEQLKQALAKMLPEEISYLKVISYESGKAVCLLQWGAKWNDERDFMVQNTEFLHLCWMVEQTLTPDEWNEFKNAFEDFSSRSIFPTNFMHATWQQRVVALAKVKGIEIKDKE